jgi:hypothetical protein
MRWIKIHKLIINGDWISYYSVSILFFYIIILLLNNDWITMFFVHPISKSITLVKWQVGTTKEALFTHGIRHEADLVLLLGIYGIPISLTISPLSDMEQQRSSMFYKINKLTLLQALSLHLANLFVNYMMEHEGSW